MYLPQEIIRKKRDNKTLSKDEILFFVKGLNNNSFSNEQIATMSMAIFLNGMNDKETVDLTMAMTNSGDVLKWDGLIENKFICDKHSTGGVGDKVSLLLAPILAACGFYVPMISGRGLGHTGGTLDKFDAIPGYNTQPSIETFKKVVKEVGCAIIGQTANLAPADKKLYSIRDVVGTVESIPLIASSIMSKKIASGIKNLVIDIKVGNGSFNPTEEIANNLASSLISIAKISGLKCSAVLTDMNQVLGFNAGHSLEIIESIEFLTKKRMNERLKNVTFKLCAEIIRMNQENANYEESISKINKVIDSGKAAEKFEKMVSALGGSKKILSNYNTDLGQALYKEDIFSQQSGYVESIFTRQIGLLLIELGGGRKQINDPIDYSVGFGNVLNIGDPVDNKIPLLTVYSNEKKDIEKIKENIKSCFVISKKRVESKNSIYRTIT